jgi:ClpP class serine protease
MPSGAGKSVALLPMYGICTLRLDFAPYSFSTLALTQKVRELAGDPSVSGIVLDVSSPGGMVTGTKAAADAVRAAAMRKPVVVTPPT